MSLVRHFPAGMFLEAEHGPRRVLRAVLRHCCSGRASRVTLPRGDLVELRRLIAVVHNYPSEMAQKTSGRQFGRFAVCFRDYSRISLITSHATKKELVGLFTR